ncbi:hypothetical protein CEP53_012813 [Fusarium sp. AF-6]|nr:hypothetical protein CEP53_012813 [Fusarium sp. AF-6]
MSSGKLDCDSVEPALSVHLLSIYWNRQQHSGLIVYRPAFVRDMACGGPYFSKLLLNAMYFAASKHSPCSDIRKDPNGISTAGWAFRQRVSDLLSETFDKSSITAIQALLIMTSSLFSRCDERSVSWLYAGHAFNMIIDLGLHVLSPETASAEDLEVQRRVYWSAYIIDKIHSLYQGRPPILCEAESNIPVRFLDDFEELEGFNTLSYSTGPNLNSLPLYNITVLTKTCELCMIMERLLTGLYSGKRSRMDHIQSHSNVEVV